MRRWLALLLWVLVALGSHGCGAPSAPPSGPTSTSTPAVTPGVSPLVQPAPQVSLTVSSPTAQVGRDVRVALDVHDAHQLYAVAITLAYDPEQLAYVGHVEGDLLNRDGAPTVVDVAPSEESHGELLVGLSRIGEVGGVSGSGTLLTLVFQTKESGQARIQVDQATATMRDADDALLAVNEWPGVTLAIQ